MEQDKLQLPETVREELQDNDFFLFITDLRDKEHITEEQYEQVAEQLQNQDIQKLIKLALKLEAIYLAVVIPIAAYISFDDIDQIQNDPQSLVIETIAFIAGIKTFRAIMALYLANKISLPNKVLFSLIEAIPHVGRAAPAIWMLRHGELGELFYIYQKTKRIRKKIHTEKDKVKRDKLSEEHSQLIGEHQKGFERIEQIIAKISGAIKLSSNT